MLWCPGFGWVFPDHLITPSKSAGATPPSRRSSLGARSTHRAPTCSRTSPTCAACTGSPRTLRCVRSSSRRSASWCWPVRAAQMTRLRWSGRVGRCRHSRVQARARQLPRRLPRRRRKALRRAPARRQPRRTTRRVETPRTAPPPTPTRSGLGLGLGLGLERRRPPRAARPLPSPSPSL